MRTVYIETTIPSFYFETRRNPTIVAWREATRAWWAKSRARYRVVTSRFVLDELSLAPASKRRDALAMLEDIELIPELPKTATIISEYIRNKVMPGEATGDAAHLAITSQHGIDFLLTWNCQHLANANKQGHIREINQKLGLSVPIITTPYQLEAEIGS